MDPHRWRCGLRHPRQRSAARITVEHTIAEVSPRCRCDGVCLPQQLRVPHFRAVQGARRLDAATRLRRQDTALAVGSIADFASPLAAFKRVALSVLTHCSCASSSAAIFCPAQSSRTTRGTRLGDACLVRLDAQRLTDLIIPSRQATSFLLAISYFVTIPSLYSNFGTKCDDHFNTCWDVSVLSRWHDGRQPWTTSTRFFGRKGFQILVCTSCGCRTSHSIWHAFSVAAAIKGAAESLRHVAAVTPCPRLYTFEFTHTPNRPVPFSISLVFFMHSPFHHAPDRSD